MFLYSPFFHNTFLQSMSPLLMQILSGRLCHIVVLYVGDYVL